MILSELTFAQLLYKSQGPVSAPAIRIYDADYSQFFANPLATNPATAGVTYSDGGGRVGINYRNQWQGKYTAAMSSWDQEFKKLKGGIGLMMMNDQGDYSFYRVTSISAVYSFKHVINDKLNFHYGLQTEWRSNSLNWNQYVFQDQIDPTLGFIYPTNEPYIPVRKENLNFSLGFLAKHEKCFVGIAVHNITEPNISVTSREVKWPRRYTLHGGTNIELKKYKNWQLSPQLLLIQQGNSYGSRKMNIGLLAGNNHIYFGSFYRQTFEKKYNGISHLIGVLGFKTKHWRLGYSFDREISSTPVINGGSHELSLSFAYCNKKVSKETHKGMMW